MNLLLPDRWKLLGLFIVASKSVDSALNKNEPELGIFVLPVPLQMLSDGNSFLNEVVQILRNLRSKPCVQVKFRNLQQSWIMIRTKDGQLNRNTMSLENPQDLAASDTLHLGNAMRITKNNTNLRWCQTLFGKLTNVFFNLNQEMNIYCS